MSEQTKKWKDCVHSLSRNALYYLVAALSFVLCYRAGEMHLLEDKNICAAICAERPHQVVAPSVQEVPFEGMQ